ncbi:MAG: helix-hairpin-helix domain-containing protein, partial [Bacteroidales bacterium]|nr:helix-hairpin-helix domain-containing protein [Bacteroidales bacterium]
MKQIYIDYISQHLAVKSWQVENCITLLEDGCTIPFISRYRKEKTGGLDDVAVAEVSHWAEVFTEMEKRKETILGTISEAGKLTPELQRRIEESVSSSELEDLYLPYRPKRKTRASVAIEKGLEPLADALWNATLRAPSVEARRYVGDKVPSVEEALAGARDIVAERLSETASVRSLLRESFRQRRVVTKVTKAGAEHPEAAKYRSYFNYTAPIAKIQAHNLLAILRAVDEGILSVGLDTDAEKCTAKLFYEFFKGRRYPSEETGAELKTAFADGFKRLLEPSISGEILREAKQKADIESVGIFGENLRQLLLAPPVGGKRTMAIDPGFRTGCKVVCLDERGALLHYEAIFPHPPMTRKIESITAIGKMVEQYRPEVIAVGSGTAGRETAEFLKRCYLPDGVKVYMVSEDGASVYSASEIGREEFPDYDVTVRGAVSIGRRLQDPLAELVKIDPKSLGVGQYQHDVDQGLLKEKLDNTVLICVNAVGVNLNTASEYLLRYVSGIGPVLAKNIVAYRGKIGGFTSRRQLLEVPRLGAKAFEQCAGFLRIPGAENSLDAGATKIEVELKRSGLGSITVADNGKGIDREDVPVAFLRHATSKISGAEDLEAIGTLGFRGEALAAICAVSKVTMITRTEDSRSGWEYRIEGGMEISLEECGAAPGTRVTVSDIFYNTPARMKFLKKDVYEGNAVEDVVWHIALANPDV